MIAQWKKAYEGDLESIVLELKGHIDSPALILLTGPVGAGKTSFAKVFAKDCGQNDALSPTYAIVEEYGSVLHADLYRLESPEELIHLELELYLDAKEFFLVEWGKEYIEYLKNDLPVEMKLYELSIEIIDGPMGPRNYHLSALE